MVTRNNKFLGLGFVQSSDMPALAREVVRYEYKPNSREIPVIFTPNSYIISKLDNYPELIDLNKCAFILPDGQPLIWLSRNLKQRLTGADLFNQIWNKHSDIDSSSLFIAPNKISLLKFQSTFPNVEGIIAPELNDLTSIQQYASKVSREIISRKPKFVFIHIGFPKQEQLTLAVLKKLAENKADSLPLFLCLGASLEFYVGLQKRAPLWMQKNGLEWLFRWIRQPKRLFKRYFIHSPRLLIKVIEHSLAK